MNSLIKSFREQQQQKRFIISESKRPLASAAAASQQQSSSNIFSQSFTEATPETSVESSKPKTVTVRLTHLRYSQWKLVALLKAIRGLSYREAIAQLSFAPQGPFKIIRGLVKQARYKGEYDLDMNPERLIVNQIWVGRSACVKSFEPRARGHHGFREKPFCHVTVELKEVPLEEGEKRLGKFGKTHKTFAKYDGNYQYNKKY
eukprot:gene2655-3295_t